MPTQEEHDQPENLVEEPGQAAHTARTLGEAADSNHTLEGYFSINNSRESTEPDSGSLTNDKSKGK
jgi:hypothetical protein